VETGSANFKKYLSTNVYSESNDLAKRFMESFNLIDTDTMIKANQLNYDFVGILSNKMPDKIRSAGYGNYSGFGTIDHKMFKKGLDKFADKNLYEIMTDFTGDVI
jgi:hypothetical protein